MLNSCNVIFGLTADPIHLGHEQAIINGIEYLTEQDLEVKQFLLVPVYQPNLIANKTFPTACFEDRVNMCELAAKRLSKQLANTIGVSQIEKQIAQTTGKHNYSLNTIKKLTFENCLFMVSADHFMGRWPKFRNWYKWQELLKHSGLLINQRPKHSINKNYIEKLKQINPNVHIIKNKQTVDTSSSSIKENLGEIKNNKYLSEDIKNYILKNKVY